MFPARLPVINKKNLSLGQQIKKLFSKGEQGIQLEPWGVKADWRINMLKSTNSFASNNWNKINSTFFDDTVEAPDGSLTASKWTPVPAVDPGASAYLVGVYQAVNTNIGDVITQYIKLKPVVVTSTYPSPPDQAQVTKDVTLSLASDVSDGAAVFNLNTLEVVQYPAGHNARIIPDENGYYVFATTYTTTTSDSTNNCIFRLSNKSTGIGFDPYPDGNEEVHICQPQVTLGPDIKPYQKITDGIVDYFEYHAQPIMFQDTMGTIPITEYGQSVGLRLDKSKGLVRGPNLVTNGGFDTADNWVISSMGWTIVGGVAQADGVTASMQLYQAVGSVVGSFYEVEFDVIGDITPSSFLNVRLGLGGTLLSVTSKGHKKAILQAAGSFPDRVYFTGSFTFKFNGAIDNISVKELVGNHAYQNSASMKAIFGRIPETGKNNILANSVMAGGGAVPTGFNQNYATGTSVPYGTINGNTQYRHTATGSERPEFTLSVGTLGTSGSITASLFIDEVLSGSPTIVSMIYMGGPVESTIAYFKNGVAADSTDLVSAGDRISATLTSGGTSGNVTARVGLGSGASMTADVVFSRPMINTGDTALNYQNSVSDYDTTEDGVPTLYGLKYDGFDDHYITPSIDFTGTDKMTVWTGVRKLSSAQAEILGLGSLVSGGFYVLAPPVAGINSDSFGLSIRGAVTQTTFSKGAPSDTNFVIAGKFDLTKTYPDAEMKLIYNGVNTIPEVVPTADSGIDAFANQPLYIGRRAGTSLPFNGWEFGIIVRGLESTDKQISAVTKYLNNHTGAF